MGNNRNFLTINNFFSYFRIVVVVSFKKHKVLKNSLPGQISIDFYVFFKKNFEVFENERFKNNTRKIPVILGKTKYMKVIFLMNFVSACLPPLSSKS
jgi:hypothetical protein